jgi:hypothetical protein
MHGGRLWRIVALTGLAAGSCGGPGSTVRPDETSVEGHRQEADRERTAAAEARLHDQPSTRVISPSVPGMPWDPTSGTHDPAEDHRYESRWHAEHARDHEAAAQALEQFEANECHGIAPSERAACPLLGPVASILDLPRGVRVQLASTVSVERTLARLRCHYAFARARGFGPTVASCPLFMRGIDIKAAADGRAIEILGSSRQQARELQRRTRQQAVFAKPSS